MAIKDHVQKLQATKIQQPPRKKASHAQGRAWQSVPKVAFVVGLLLSITAVAFFVIRGIKKRSAAERRVKLLEKNNARERDRLKFFPLTYETFSSSTPEGSEEPRVEYGPHVPHTDLPRVPVALPATGQGEQEAVEQASREGDRWHANENPSESGEGEEVKEVSVNKNYSGNVINHRTFEGENLSGANFERAILNGVIFINVDLTKANFERAIFNGCDFTNARNLERANFSGAKKLNCFGFEDAPMSGPSTYTSVGNQHNSYIGATCKTQS